MKKLFYLLVITLSFNSFGQNLIPNYEIGCYFDYNKQLINGYSDFDYEPGKSLDVSYVMDENFTEGYYLDLDGVKNTGFLKFSSEKYGLKFKLNLEDKNEELIKAENCNGFVIGKDTLFIVRKNDFSDDQLSNDVFAQFMDKFEKLKFYKYKHLNGNGSVVNKYFVQKPDESGNIIFPTNSNKFKKLAAEIFSSDNFLIADIEKGKYKEKDIPSMIKIYKYRKLFANNQKIYFNSSWDETINIDESPYYAKIESVQDSIFHLSYYFNNDVKIYEGDFTSFYPHKKRGVFLFYYPNGTMRKQIKYKDNKPKNVMEYFSNGEVHRQYLYLYGDDIICAKVNDEKGISILKDYKNVEKESFRDVITGKEITYEYKDQVLQNAYYTDANGIKIYQLCKKNAKLNDFNDLQKLTTDKLKYPLSSIQKYSHGYVLIKCIIEPTGIMSEATLIKGIDTDCDFAINDFLTQFKDKIVWKPGKVDGVNVKQEIILPFDFSIQGFSTYNNHYNNFWMLNHMMMQQQMMMNQQWMNQQMMRVPMGRF